MARSRYPRVFGSASAMALSRAAFSAAGGFFPVLDAALGGLIESNLVTLANVGSAVPLTIAGGSYSKNGGAYSTTATTVSDGDTLKIRVTAPSTNSATATATISINSIARNFSVTTVGVIVTPTPSGGTPDGPEETLFATYPSTERSTFSFEKQGMIFPRPVSMGSKADGFGNGNYWVDVMKDPCDLYPDRGIAIFSTDHTEYKGGMFMFVCGGDWRIRENWKEFGTPEANAILYDKGSMPTSNPVTTVPFGGAGIQLETFCVNRVGAVWVATAQIATDAKPAPDGTGAFNQASIRGISNDLIHWTWSDIALATTARLNAIGDSHSGYFKWGPNPFPGLINPATGKPYSYMGYRLIGGQSVSTCAVYGWENPATEQPLFITALSKFGGRAAGFGDNPQVGSPITLDPRSARLTPQGVAVTMSFSTRGSGATLKTVDVSEVIMSLDGLSVLRKPVKILLRGGTGAFDSTEIGGVRIRNFGDKRLAFYDAIGNGEGTIGFALSDKRNPGNTYHEPLVPAIPAAFTTRNYDFKGATAIPDDLIMVKSSSSVADPVFDSTGMKLTLLNGEEIWFFEKDGFNPNTTSYADVYLKGWRIAPPASGESVAALWIPYIGFAGAKTIAGAHSDMLFISNGEGSVPQFTMHAKVNGAEPQTFNDSEYYWGIGYGAASTSAARKKNVGVRLFPQDNLAIALGEGGGDAEMERFQNAAGTNYATFIDKSKTLYRSFGFKGTNPNAATAVLVEGLALKGPNPFSGTGDVTAPAITSSLTGSIAENSAYSTTLSASESVTWTKRTGADSAMFALNSLTGVLTLPAQNFESAADADANNTYVCNLTATDASGNTTNFTHTVTVTDVANETTSPVTVGSHSQYGSSANNQPYTLATGTTTFNGNATAPGVIPLGAEGSNRRVIVGFSGRAGASTSAVAVTITPNAGAAIVMTQIGTFRSTSGADTGSSEITVYQALVPVGSTATIAATTTPTNSYAREGMGALVVYGVNPSPIDVQTVYVPQSQQAVGFGEVMSVNLDRVAGGLSVAFVQHSGFAGTHFTSGYEVPTANANDVPVSNASDNATSVWTGIANTLPSIQEENTASVTGIMIALTFAPA